MKALVAVALWVSCPVFACINGPDGTTIDGRAHTGGGGGAAFFLRRSMAVKLADITAEERFGEPHTADEEKQMEALNRIFTDDLPGAITLLNQLERETPGDYRTVANLGTAYELIGDNANALKWITAGMNRNPDSHKGTEWLHVLILEAKIEAAKHPDQPLPDHLLQVPERAAADTSIVMKGIAHSAQDVLKALQYQLNERVVFVKPKDPYVADLLYSYALLQANFVTVESGGELLQLAREYGFPDEALLKTQEKRFESIIRYREIKWWSRLGLGLAAFFSLLWYFHRRKWFFLTHRAYKAHQAALAAAARTAR